MSAEAPLSDEDVRRIEHPEEFEASSRAKAKADKADDESDAKS
jgi:hypothetical protein